MKKIAILGSTGSIGTQSIDVAHKHGYKVTALTAHSNAKLLEEQARLLKPEMVALYNEDDAKMLVNLYCDLKKYGVNVETLYDPKPTKIYLYS